MKTNDNNPFSPKNAKRGYTRDGQAAIYWPTEPMVDNFELIGYVEDGSGYKWPQLWRQDGSFSYNRERHALDIMPTAAQHASA